MVRKIKAGTATATQRRIFGVPEFPLSQPQLEACELSELARSFWAKSGNAETWLSVVQHLLDSADVAGYLFDEYLSEHHRQLMASVWGGDQAKARASLTFLMSIHDLGKVSPQFSCQRSDLAELIRNQGLVVMRKRDYPERSYLPHGLVSQFALQDEINEADGDPAAARQWAILVGVHHGRYPDAAAVALAQAQYKEGSSQDDPRWGQARSEILCFMARRSGFPLNAPDTALPELPIAVASAYASALVIADWLASNEDYFPLRLRPVDDSGKLSISGYPELNARQQHERVRQAWKRAQFPTPMRIPSFHSENAADFYRHRFSWPASYQPTKAQREVIEIAAAENPDLMIVEAPPGSGKTALAFAAAEVLMRERGLQGIFVALPTQATTNAMFERVTSWLTSILGDEPQKLGVHLAHGKNSLNKSFMELLENGHSPLEVYDDDADSKDNGLHASRWMGQRWRSTLSPVVVGTIDQVLLAALKSRHVLVRHLGLMGKVVIIDEVHAADAYMQTYLKAALTWLGMYQIPVVLLSATLPPERRRELLDAYRRGQGATADNTELDKAIGYPVISTVAAAEVRIHEIEGEPEVTKQIIPTQVASAEEIAKLLEQELADGGCAVVIRNTVREAQETYAAVKKVFGRQQATLLHARFLAVERSARDSSMLELFGKNSTKRPQRHVVVATQVIEQSLDVDFDLMLTDPAPMDLVLQRIGRLHRHAGRNRPQGLQAARCLVLVNDLTSAPWSYSSGTDYIYARYMTLRTLGILADRRQITVSKPNDYAQLTALAYNTAESVGPKQWGKSFAQAKCDYQRDCNQSQIKAHTWCLDGANLPKWKAPELEEKFMGNAATGEEANGPAVAASRAAVRDGEDQIPVLVVALDPELNNVPVAPPISGVQPDETPLAVDEYNARGRIADICSWSISLPPWAFCDNKEDLDCVVDDVAKEIWDDPITQDWACRQHPLLAGELILAMYLSPDGTQLTRELYGRKLTYSIENGLEVRGK